jgi:hypothetical protein
MQEEFFKADWSSSLLVSSTLISLLLVGATLFELITNFRSGDRLPMLVAMIPIILLFISAIFSVRGYRLEDRTLYVKRLGWYSEINLEALRSAEIDPQAMTSSVRWWGNGGLFSYSGSFYSPRIGAYTAYGTKPQQAVVLRFPEKTIVLTPDQPDRFVSKVLETNNLAGAS